MDAFDRQRYAAAYRVLAEILERDRPAEQEQRHLSYVLGDLARRIFVGTDFVPPDELLEEVAAALRSPETDDQKSMARRLRRHAAHLYDTD